MFFIKSESFSLITPCSSAISANVEISSLLKKSSFFDAPIDLVNACRIHNMPVYLKIGIIDDRKIVVNFAKLFQYFAPIVLGIISRGLRNPADFEFEKKIALFNNSLGEIETIFFLTSPNNAFISSSMVREIIENGGNYKKFVPESVSA